MKFYDITFFVEGNKTKARISPDNLPDSPWPCTLTIETGSFKGGRIKLHFSTEAFLVFADSVAECSAEYVKGLCEEKEDKVEELNEG